MVDAPGIVDALAHDPETRDRISFRATLPARAAVAATTGTRLHPETTTRLEARGADPLWSHQARAIDALLAGRNIAITTGTASGKSLAYQVPVVEEVVTGGTGTALLLFPTKALAQDQLRSLRSWLVPDLRAVTYDGDTAPADRSWARKNANVVLTNPEMLHVGMLPFHRRWATFLMRLRYVVVDEMHGLRGIFGAHVAFLLRRLRRLCEHYHASPAFCFTSATVGHAAGLAESLCGLPVEVVADDGGPRAERELVVWERPMVDRESGRRTSAHTETGALLARFVEAGQCSLAFARSRRGTELVAATARRLLTERGAPELAARVSPYRAGYLPEERRELERMLDDGRLLGVAATNALELGIDVGGLDVAILDGFPGTLASFRQQIGRAGRGDRRAVAVLVTGDDQLDRWYADHPEELLSRPPEAAVVNLANPFVVGPQVACAAHELPLSPPDHRYFGDPLDDAVRDLTLADRLKPRHGRFYWAGPRAPAPTVGLRSGIGHEVELVEGRDGRLVGTVDESRAFEVAHPGAIYVHRGAQWRVESLDPAAGRAALSPADDADEYTQVRSETEIEVVGGPDGRVSIGFGEAHLGSVEVATQVTGYRRRRVSTGEVIENVALDLPPRTLTTRAIWYSAAPTVLTAAGLDPSRFLASAHAAEHALIGLLPLFAICDRWDVGGVSLADHPSTAGPTVFVYDGYPGGAGIAELAFADLERHVAATLGLVTRCPCRHGCPSCVQSPKCGNLNEHLDKAGAVTLLGVLAGAGAQPDGADPEPGSDGGSLL